MSVVVAVEKKKKKMSLFLKKKGGFRLCSGEGSTLTVDGRKCVMAAGDDDRQTETLEEMILRVEEMELRRNEAGERTSCVSSADVVVISARNAALSQYPRFSLDGRDAMYRCSFTRRSEAERKRRCLPAVVGGERVVWCKPGVVAKLMGLEAIPVPLGSSAYRREKLAGIIRRQNERRRGGGGHFYGN
ncbi:hypothetical protein M569_00897 [Genlisea aurea]|uniref:DUF3741 domain-containing protein n=1 Tax=Genlisea aurea TaxID=192259 RepID=S8EMG8_9LAMI|nr:hypothetical protein M569_00897 [Genlisea aurea]